MTSAMEISDRYLTLPVRNGAPERMVHLLRGDEVVRYFSIALAFNEEPDWFAFCDLEEFAGETLRVRVDGEEVQNEVMSLLELSGEPKGLEGIYGEELRPQFHFSARRGHLCDPDGLFYYNGVYHLFFQHNPFGLSHGAHWGHAVSSDLVHWKELTSVLYPDRMGLIYSGSAVVDHENTSGLGKDGRPPIVLFYTAAGDRAPTPAGYTQCIAYSIYGGESFRKYSGNPVVEELTSKNRDPKVVWHEPSKQWTMVLFRGVRSEKDEEKAGLFTFLGSNNLLQWRHLSQIEMEWSAECPELFELPLDGDPSNTKWVLQGANGRYFAGDFDGERFLPETGLLPLHTHDWTHCKKDRTAYAAQTFTNAPDGRRIMIAWLFSSIPAKNFNMAMTFPVELSLRTVASAPHVCAEPIREIEALYRTTHDFRDITPTSENIFRHIDAELFDVSITFTPQPRALVKLSVRGVDIHYDAHARMLHFDNKAYPLEPTDGAIDLRVLVDRTSVEVFANSGILWIARGIFPHPSARSLSLADLWAAPTRVARLTVHELASIWKLGQES